MNLLLLMQRYVDSQPIPRNLPDYCLTCCDRVNNLRQNRGMSLYFVAKVCGGFAIVRKLGILGRTLL
jgi:hypothetical protein